MRRPESMKRTVPERTDCDDVLRRLFGLSRLQLLCYRTLAEAGPLRADELSIRLRRESSTVYRSLHGLVTSGLAYFETRTLAQGGYYHLYSSIPPSALRARMKGLIEQLRTKALTAIDRMEQ